MRIRTWHRRVGLAGGVVIALTALQALPAAATDDRVNVDLAAPVETLSALLPGQFEEPIPDATPVANLQVDGSNNVTADVAPTLDKLTADAVADAQVRAPEVLEEIKAPQVDPVTFDLPGDLTRVATDSEIEAFVDDNAGSAQYVLPTQLGVQIMTVATSRPDTDIINIPIRVESGAVNPVVQDDGSVKVFRDDGSQIGTISPPWAKDATGKEVSTRFEVDGRLLIQWVDYGAPEIKFPVVSDPNWTYSITWDIGPASKIDATKVRAEYYKCFKCIFNSDPALTGAPKNFPLAGDVIPLKLGGIGNFTVRKGDEWYIPSRNNFGWQFIAESGHIDGAGSKITFDYYDQPFKGRFVQVVSAYIKNDFPLGNEFYREAASRSWTYMANTLRLLIVGVEPGPPPGA